MLKAPLRNMLIATPSHVSQSNRCLVGPFVRKAQMESDHVRFHHAALRFSAHEPATSAEGMHKCCASAPPPTDLLCLLKHKLRAERLTQQPRQPIGSLCRPISSSPTTNTNTTTAAFHHRRMYFYTEPMKYTSNATTPFFRGGNWH